jgi:chemotaxis response regulator CheB
LSQQEIEGYRVMIESDGARALPLRRAFRPDLIILDILLPGLDGLAERLGIRGTPTFVHKGGLASGSLSQETLSELASLPRP